MKVILKSNHGNKMFAKELLFIEYDGSILVVDPTNQSVIMKISMGLSINEPDSPSTNTYFINANILDAEAVQADWACGWVRDSAVMKEI